MEQTTTDEMKARLMDCDSFLEMVNVYNEYYDCSKKLGKIAKGQIINNLPKIRLVAGFKKRLKWPRAKEA